jgi:hypothetical protein
MTWNVKDVQDFKEGKGHEWVGENGKEMSAMQ